MSSTRINCQPISSFGSRTSYSNITADQGHNTSGFLSVSGTRINCQHISSLGSRTQYSKIPGDQSHDMSRLLSVSSIRINCQSILYLGVKDISKIPLVCMEAHSMSVALSCLFLTVCHHLVKSHINISLPNSLWSSHQITDQQISLEGFDRVNLLPMVIQPLQRVSKAQIILPFVYDKSKMDTICLNLSVTSYYRKKYTQIVQLNLGLDNNRA